MERIASSIESYRRKPEGHAPHLMSSLSGPALAGEVARAWNGVDVPADAIALWNVCRRAHLFEDTDHRASGLVLLDPKTSARRTAENVQTDSRFADDDLVIGEFLNSQELVIIAPSETGRRRIMIALAVVDRESWFGAGTDLADFLEAYFCAGGESYWDEDEDEDED
jgi:hypothetical protein